MRGKAVVIRQANRVEPELGFAISSLDMNVRRFVALMRIRVKSIATFRKTVGIAVCGRFARSGQEARNMLRFALRLSHEAMRLGFYDVDRVPKELREYSDNISAESTGFG